MIVSMLQRASVPGPPLPRFYRCAGISAWHTHIGSPTHTVHLGMETEAAVDKMTTMDVRANKAIATLPAQLKPELSCNWVLREADGWRTESNRQRLGALLAEAQKAVSPLPRPHTSRAGC